MFLILSVVVGGLVIGALGRLVVPGRQPIGCLWTVLVGLGGSVLGGIVSRSIWADPWNHRLAVIGLEDGMVPIAYATTPEALAEERRLLYVALTRAEDELWCSWARVRRAGDRTWRCDPSPLLDAVEKASRDRGPAPDAEQLSSRIASLRTMLPTPADRAS